MKLLLVEDEHKIANSIKQGLELENFVVDMAHTGTLGLDLALSEKKDVIILDRLLPGLEGIEIIRSLRNSNIHTPIILLTAKGQIEDKVEGLNAGADDYIIKPFSFSELLARIKAVARRPEKALGSELSIEDLTLDTEKFMVTRAGKEIQLSSKEFMLLEFLLRHPNQTIKKDQIIRQVWDYDADVLPNSVEVYIKHLRDKIDKNHSKKLIKTIRGFGYKIGE